MPVAVKKAIKEDFSDISGGINTSKPAISIRKNQVPDAFNAIIKEKGFDRSPGFEGLKATAMFTTFLRGQHIYEEVNGTETLLSMSDGKLFSVNESTGAITELFDLTGIGEAWMANAYDKAFAANGTKAVKVEQTSSFQIGITAPAGNSIAPLAGGTLPTGTYNVFVSYARKVSGVTRLISIGESLGDVIISGGNLSFRATVANSADAQVNNKIIWVREPGASIFHFYHETNDNTTTLIDVTSDTNKDTTRVKATDADPNAIPGALQGIFFFDNRLWGWIDNQLFWSEKASGTNTFFRLEIWRTGNNALYPFNIEHLFSMGDHLYLNTVGGIIQQPFGDVTSRFFIKDTRWYFRFPRTVDAWGPFVIGVTQDGVRLFDGEKFQTFDYAKDVKPEINNLYQGFNTNFRPCGKVVTRSTRTEYHLCFRDTGIGSTINNRHLVLNLSSAAIFNENQYKTPWEEWEGGAAFITVKKDNTIHYGQSLTDGGQIFKEVTTSAADKFIFNKLGVFITVLTNKECRIQSRDFVSSIDAKVLWQRVSIMAELQEDAKIFIKIREKTSVDTSKVIPGAGGAKFGEAVFGADTFGSEHQLLKHIPIKRQIAGVITFWIFTQTSDDENMDVGLLILEGILRKTRFT